MPKKSSSTSGQRGLHVRVKTAKSRSLSSTRWLERQFNDPYVRKAKAEGYRSRTAYKLIEMNEQFHFLKKQGVMIDLGAAPGGWLQVLANYAPHSTIIGLDLLPIEPLAGVTTLQCDFTTDEGYELLRTTLGGKKADLVLSDMAPSACGHASTDHLRIMAMCELALAFAKDHLKEEGTFIAKVLKGGTEKFLLDDMKKSFRIIKHTKPDASRKESSEMYVVAMGYRNKTA